MFSLASEVKVFFCRHQQKSRLFFILALSNKDHHSPTKKGTCLTKAERNESSIVHEKKPFRKQNRTRALLGSSKQSEGWTESCTSLLKFQLHTVRLKIYKSWSTCGLGSLTFFTVQHIIVMHVRGLFCPFQFIRLCLNEHKFYKYLHHKLLPQLKRSLLFSSLLITLNPHLPPLQVEMKGLRVSSAPSLPLSLSWDAALELWGSGSAWPPWCCHPEGWMRTTVGCWERSSALGEGRTGWCAAWLTPSWREDRCWIEETN